MQNSQLPAKWLKPFAADDPNKVELPLTSADPTRASQSAGFPPLTMQPPESGGVPPQGEDFNGGMNQVARFVWWYLAGGALPFDNTWTTNAAIGGYPNGGRVTSADLQGEWISTADNNTNNPDTVGTNWVPGYAHGSTQLAGLTNANVTLTPAQAAKPIIRLAGTLTGNIQIIFPVWVRPWTIINACTGGFSVTCKTAAGAGVVVSQGGGTQIVWGDGTNLNALGGNSATPLLVGSPVLSTHAAQLGQTGPRSVDAVTATGNYTVPAGVYSVHVRAWAGGGGSGGLGVASAGGTGGGGGGSYGEGVYAVTPGQIIACTVGAAGTAGGAGGAGGTGGATSFGAFLTTNGGVGSAGTAAGNAGAGGAAGTGGVINYAGGTGNSGATGTSGQGGAGGGASMGGAGGGGAAGPSSGGVNPGGGGGGRGSASTGSGSAGGVGLILIDY